MSSVLIAATVTSTVSWLTAINYKNYRSVAVIKCIYKANALRHWLQYPSVRGP